MNEHNSDSRDFRPDYAALELNDRADWEAVRANYRRLVHLWHPDRYAMRPRERVHAQQNFISLNKSYTHLRNFHREYGHLPFEPTANRSTNTNMDIFTPDARRKAFRDNTSDSHRAAPGTATSVPDVEPGVLGRDRTIRASGPDSRSRNRIVWALAGCSIIFATLFIFFLLDRKANEAILERGREVVRDAPASDFMPSAAEIRRSEAKGAFVQPTK
ncbi:DnaJ domain-containing protein [Granulosicoccus sp. 3-233]|uniref:DnaJ domain-containing protein n=1 Tax=Granulosicoccus sp. 3-233 TaxID=3417969 RepID=UPI003D358164